MSKVRRFAVPSLEGIAVGTEFTLPEAEARHIRVLRLTPGTEIELTDVSGREALVEIIPSQEGVQNVRTLEIRNEPNSKHSKLLTLAVAWPKGKRAAVMVEKCAELGVDLIVPLSFERSVVSKDDESEGISRLKRVAAEASKQSGRAGMMSIGREVGFNEFLNQRKQMDATALTVLLDPRGKTMQSDVVSGHTDIACIIGPEGGFSDGEIAAIEAQNIARVRIAEHVLRIETAAISAAALFGLAIHTDSRPQLLQ